MLKTGDRIRFKEPAKYDGKEHIVLNVQKTHGDILYFTHYFSWVDEDDVILIEDKMKVEVGKTYWWSEDDKELNEHFTVTKIEGDVAYYTYADGLESTEKLKSVMFDTLIEYVAPVVATQHYNSTKITALDVIDDAINPSHYNGTEVFDQMILIYGTEAVKGFCICNAFKYRQRAGKKSEAIEQDIKKAIWYELKYSELNENK